jgi:hypothetical protein
MRGYCVKEKPTVSSRSGEGDQLPQQPRLPSVESLNQAAKSLRSNIVLIVIKTKVVKGRQRRKYEASLHGLQPGDEDC